MMVVFISNSLGMQGKATIFPELWPPYGLSTSRAQRKDDCAFIYIHSIANNAASNYNCTCIMFNVCWLGSALNSSMESTSVTDSWQKD